jgi:hypothetical protein
MSDVNAKVVYSFDSREYYESLERQNDALKTALIELLSGTKEALCDKTTSFDCIHNCPMNKGNGECVWTKAFKVSVVCDYDTAVVFSGSGDCE